MEVGCSDSGRLMAFDCMLDMILEAAKKAQEEEFICQIRVVPFHLYHIFLKLINVQID
jgi:hypothetical protein